VNHSQTLTARVNHLLSGRPSLRLATKRTVVITAPISTPSMTVLPSRCSGLSLANEATIAWRMMSPRKIEMPALRSRAMADGRCVVTVGLLEQGAGVKADVLSNRPQGDGGEERQATNDDDDAGKQPHEQRSVGRQRRSANRDALLARQGAGQGQR